MDEEKLIKEALQILKEDPAAILHNAGVTVTLVGDRKYRINKEGISKAIKILSRTKSHYFIESISDNFSDLVMT